MTDGALLLDDVVHRAEGAILTLRLRDETVDVAIDAIGQSAVDTALRTVAELLGSGSSLSDAAAAAARSSADIPRRCARWRLPNGALLIDDTASATALDVRRSLAMLADITRRRTRSFAVLGELEASAGDWFEDHDALGRIVVRLDVSQLIVVGDRARHIHNAAGLEGSWDGESVLVGTVDEAYDVVRAQVVEGDVVLVSAGALTPLETLVSRLMEADR